MDAIAESGSIDRLYALIHEYPSILEQIDAAPFIDTPTHTAAAFGNIPFVMEMMNLKPSFARKLNPRGLIPLHLALEGGHTQLAEELTEVDPSLIRVKGKEGMTPLHFVAKQGDVKLLESFCRASPECIGDVNTNGETALHIAVNNHKYPALNVLTRWLMNVHQKDADEKIKREAIRRQDRQGNTVFHIAANENHHQALPILFRWETVDRVIEDIKNKEGLTTVDILKNQAQDMNEYIKKIMTPYSWKAIDKKMSMVSSSGFRANISDGTRGAILVILALLITINFQMVLSPPGGVYQADASTGDESKNVTARPEYKEGKAVMGLGYFFPLWICNTLSFSLAIRVTYAFLPAGQRYLNWFFITSFMLFLSYMMASFVISPGPLSYMGPILTFAFAACYYGPYVIQVGLIQLFGLFRIYLFEPKCRE